jgi:hypothetical protein
LPPARDEKEGQIVLMTIQRYWKAFWKALRMTLRGEQVESSPHDELLNWSRRTVDLVREVLQAADQDGMDQSARQTIRIRADGREMSMHTILSGIEHHAAVEYPMLIRTLREDSFAVIQANNTDDQFRLTRLIEAEAAGNTTLQTVLRKLEAHLRSQPAPVNVDKKL